MPAAGQKFAVRSREQIGARFHHAADDLVAAMQNLEQRAGAAPFQRRTLVEWIGLCQWGTGTLKARP